MSELVRKAVVKLRRDGLVSLTRVGVSYLYANFLRDFFPTERTAVRYNGVESPVEVCVFDPYVPEYDSPWHADDIPDYEDEEVTGLHRHVSEGDTVLVIGGGFGVTSVVAANEAGESGSVVTYEAAENCVERVERTVRHNDVADQVDVNHAIVSEPIDLRGDPGDAGIVSPSELPDADVVEMDCEGAELEILREMEITPRTVLVETHAQFGAPRDRVLAVLEERGYRIESVVDKDWEGVHHITAVRRQ